jgi:membrane peptidoglycan carboxypeptidase
MPGRATNFTNIVSLLGAFLATSVVLGLLGAGLVMPAVGATGATARQGVHVFDTLPSDFALTPLSQQSRILASDGTLIVTPYDENRIIVPLSKIAPVMRQAQIAIEDSRYYEHGGIDPLGVGRAFVSNLGGGDTQGASTLTQQYVKITLQENALRKKDTIAARAATAKSYTRKLQELKYAVTLEKTLTKDQILEGYLNLVYYGDLAYGVEAAARNYFGVSAAKLNLPQAATLAGLVQQPGVTDPIHHPAKALARRNVVLDRMHALNLITDKAWQAARRSKIATNPRPAQNSCASSPYPYFCTYVINWLKEQKALGATTADRIEAINRGGLTIQTTLNPKIEKAARKELIARVPVGNSEKIGAAAAVVEPGTGHVLAIAQNTTFAIKASPGKTAVNWSVDKKYGGSIGFAFGSTAKMFAIAEALRSGMPIDSTVIARAASTSRGAFFSKADFHDSCTVDEKGWTVRNDEDTATGPISLTKAAAKSVNTAFAVLVSKVGACSVRDLMARMGLHQGSGQKMEGYPAAVTLGANSVSPLTLATAYATAASGGTYCVPTPVLAITTSDRKALKLPKSDCKKVLEPDVANGVSKILKSVLTSGTGRGIGGLDGGRPVAGKTGTSDKSNETWFAGYTPQLSTAVWVGTPDGPNDRALRDLQLGKRFYPDQVFGATIAGPIWKNIMDSASSGMPFRDFAEPSDKVLHGDLVSIPSVTGLPLGDAMAVLSSAGFTPVVGQAVASSIPIGLVVGTNPSFRALRGNPVTIFTSTGAAPTPTAPPTARPGRGGPGQGGGGLPKCGTPNAPLPPFCKN